MVSKRALLLIIWLVIALAGCVRPADDSFEAIDSESVGAQPTTADQGGTPTQPQATNTPFVVLPGQRTPTVIVIRPTTQVPVATVQSVPATTQAPSATPASIETDTLSVDPQASATNTLLPFGGLSTNTPTPVGGDALIAGQTAQPTVTNTPSITPSVTPSATDVPPSATPTQTDIPRVTPQPPSVLEFDTPTPTLTPLAGDVGDVGDAGTDGDAPPNTAADGLAFPEDCQYEIQSGDTLFGIAGRYDEFTFSELLAANPTINADSILQIGQELNIPNCQGGAYTGDAVIEAPDPTEDTADAQATSTDDALVSGPTATRTPAPRLSVTPVPSNTPLADGECLYVVRSGDTISRIAARFGVTIGAISRANNLANPDRISIDQELIIPDQTECP